MLGGDRIMLEKLIVGVFVGLVALIPALLQFISDRGKTRSRNHQVSRLSTELEFLERCANLSRLDKEQAQQAGMPPLAVEQDLARILAEYRSLKEDELQDQRGPAQVSFGRRALLLFRPSTGRGWLIHTTFYFLMIFMITALAIDLQSPTFDPETGENEFKYLLIGFLIMFGPPLFFLRRAAVRLRERELEERPGATDV